MKVARMVLKIVALSLAAAAAVCAVIAYWDKLLECGTRDRATIFKTIRATFISGTSLQNS